MAISVIQRNAVGNAAATSSIALAFGSNTTAGSALIAIATTDGAATTLTTITDTQNNTWVPVATVVGSSFRFKAWITYSVGAAANTVTVATTFQDSNLFIFEVAGLASLRAFDKVAFQNQSSSTALDSTAAVTTFANELLIGITANTPTPGLAPTVGAGFSNLQALTTNFNGGASEEQIVSATGSYSAPFGLATNTGAETTAIFTFADQMQPRRIPYIASIRPHAFSPGLAR